MPRYLDLALDIAKNSEHNFRHCAIIVKNNKIQSIALNKYIGRHFPNENQNIVARHSCHAEQQAIKQLHKKSTNATIYVARVASYGRAYSKPCDRCTKLLIQYGISKAVYSTCFGSETIILKDYHSS